MLIVAVGFIATIAVLVAVRFSSGYSGFVVRNLVLNLIISVLVGALQIGLYRAALSITAGQPLDFGSLYSSENIGPYLVTVVVIAAMVAVGDLLCFVPGVILRFLTYFGPFFVLDRQMTPGQAIRASFDLTSANLGIMIPFAIVAVLVYLAGFLACGIGILVSAPVALIAVAFAYRSLTGEPIAA